MVATFFLQSVSDVKEIISIKEVTIIGVLLFIVIALGYVCVHLYKRVDKLTELRLEEQKEFTKELLTITDRTTIAVSQVNEILKATRRNE